MAEFFGDLERLAAYAYRSGWHMFVWRHRSATTVIGAPLLALAVFVGWDVGSPLFTNKTVEEEFPFAFTAEIPDGMDLEDVEMVMSVLSKVNQAAVDETMPDHMPMKIPAAEVAGELAEQSTTEVATTEGVAVKIKTASFRDQDSIHKGSGQAAIYRGPDGSYLLRVEEFRVSNGPDLHVILSTYPNPESTEGRPWGQPLKKLLGAPVNLG